MRRAARASVVVHSRLRDVLTYRDVRVTCLLFLTAQLLDSVTTFIALETHRFHESNPWFAGPLSSHPLPTYMVKMALAVVTVLTVLLLRMRWRLRLAVLVVFAVASAIAPVANALRLADIL